jgi:hypothetical protein
VGATNKCDNRTSLAALSHSNVEMEALFKDDAELSICPEATLIAQSLARQPDLKTIHGSIQDALSLVIDRIAPNGPAMPKQVR